MHSLITLLIEQRIARRGNVTFYRMLHVINLTLSISISCIVIWVTEPNPAASTTELLMCCMLFLKLTSYVIENHRARAETLATKKSGALKLIYRRYWMLIIFCLFVCVCVCFRVCRGSLRWRQSIVPEQLECARCGQSRSYQLRRLSVSVLFSECRLVFVSCSLIF